MTAKGFIDVYLGYRIYITFANYGSTDVHLPKHRGVAELANALDVNYL